ncbi:MAG: thioredoxin domain-containing protein [bacterium]|nr:thioredoxin domain-containing protein [bacterium]
MKRLLPFLVLAVLWAGGAHAQAVTPIPTLDPARYAALPQAVNVRGFPQLGFPSAPISVVVFSAFASPAAADFWRDAFPVLVARARTGEISITFVPLAADSDTIPNGRGAGRAALCAAEQNAFWSYHDQLFTWQLAFGAEAFSPARLIDGINNTAISRAAWDECMLSDRPDAQLLEADATARSIAQSRALTITPPFVTVADAPTLPDAVSLEAAIAFESRRGAATFEAVIEATPEAEATVDPESTEPVVVTLEPLLGISAPPPLIIGLPPGWSYGYDTLVLQDVDAIRNMPVAVYTGPVTGGTGTIVLLWGFPNLIPFSPADGGVQPNLWADGLRLLRLTIVEQGCNIGTDLRREYSIGGLTAVGTQFAAVDCPELADTRGWFAGLQQFNLNFVFYAFAEPISAMDGAAADDLQRILDSVRFVLPPTPTPDPAAPTAAP